MPTLRKIVVLEDDRTSCALISSALEKAGYQVFQTQEGRYAIELVIKERPSLLISDVLVPDMNGSEVVKQLSASSFGSELNTLFLTSLLDKGDNDGAEKRLKVEGQEYPALAKPFNPEKLLEVVERIAGPPVVEDPVQVEVEEAVEVQAEEANAAVDSEETAEGEESECEGSEEKAEVEEDKEAETSSS